MSVNRKKSYYPFIQISICVLLFLATIQIMPNDSKIINNASASSTWEDSNWSTSNNYSKIQDLEQINSTGDIKLLWGNWLFITDTNNHRIVRITMEGNGWATYGSFGSNTGEFILPTGICFDNKTGFIYVTDFSNNRIVKTKMDGSGWTAYGLRGTGNGQFNRPERISYDKTTGFIYVADNDNCRIVKTMMNGTGWTTYGSRGTGNGQFKLPVGISYDKTTGFIYVADYFNCRIVKTKIDGTGWTTYGSYGNGKGQFKRPSQIDYDSTTGYSYIADDQNHRIVKTMMNGTGWTTYGIKGSGNGQFNNPCGIDYDSSTGNIYVVDKYNSRIIKTMMNGSGWTTYGSYGSGKKQLNFPQSVASGGFHFCPDGFLVSKQFNYGSPANLKTISWVADIPQDTYIKFQLRSAPNQTALETKSFRGPKGGTTNYYNKTGANIWNGHNGDRLVQYKVYLNTSNISRTPVLKDVKIVYNLLPKRPTLISPSDKTWTNDNTITFSWQLNDTDSNAQSAFQWQADDDREFNHIDYDSNIITSLQSSHTITNPLPDGFWYWRVRTKDNDDGWGSYSTPWKIQIDTKPPDSIIQFPKNNGFYNKLNIIRGTASDPEVATGIDIIELNIMRLMDSKYWDGSTWTSKDSWLMANGTTKWTYNSSSVVWTSGYQYRIHSRGKDNTTNFETSGAGIVFTYDINAPASTINTPGNNSFLNRLELISGVASDFDVSGVKKVEILIEQTSDDNYWNGETWNPNKTWLKTFGTNEWEFESSLVTWTSGTQYNIYARATDNVNNIEVPTSLAKFLFDEDYPLSQIIHPSLGSFINHLELISGNASDIAGAGIESIEITIERISDYTYWDGTSWRSDTYWLAAKGTNEWTYDTSKVQWTTDTYYSIRSKAMDNAGNDLIQWDENTFMFDNTPPEQSFIINDNAEFTNSKSVELSLDYDDSGSGVALMAFSNDGYDWSAWEPINTSKQYNLTSGDGIKVISFRMQDLAGNIAEYATSSIILDSKPPQCSIIINEDAMYTNFNQISLSLTAVDSLSGVDLMGFSFNHKKWTTWKQFKYDEKLTLPAVDGNIIVFLRVKDNAGNIGIGFDSIILDTIAPHSLIILINNGAEETISRKVTLSLIALDEHSGIHKMAFSTDGNKWTDWENFSKTASVELPSGNEEKIVYFKVMDHVGNVAQPAMDTIVLNETVPGNRIRQDTPISLQDFFNEYWGFFVIIIIIIIIGLSVVILQRKKKVRQVAPSKDTVTVKPHEFPVDSMTMVSPKISSAPTIPQLPIPTTVSTSTSLLQPLPQLPPAQIPITPAPQPQVTAQQPIQTTNQH